MNQFPLWKMRILGHIVLSSKFSKVTELNVVSHDLNLASVALETNVLTTEHSQG
jgi:hypothetical protein